MTYTFVIRLKGGPGSGHWGHAGRPGQRGGGRAGSSAMMAAGAERRDSKLGKSKNDDVSVTGAFRDPSTFRAGLQSIDDERLNTLKQEIDTEYNKVIDGDEDFVEYFSDLVYARDEIKDELEARDIIAKGTIPFGTIGKAPGRQGTG